MGLREAIAKREKRGKTGTQAMKVDRPLGKRWKVEATNELLKR